MAFLKAGFAYPDKCRSGRNGRRNSAAPGDLWDVVVSRRLLLAALGIVAVAGPARGWPDRPLRIVVGFLAGGSSDVVARLLVDPLRREFGGATVLVDNKPGAAGSIAAEAVLNARDGHSLLIFGDSLLTGALTNRSIRVRPLRDFKMVTLVCSGPLVLVAGPLAPFDTFAGFTAYARAHPGKLNYASAGIGGQQHLTGEYIAARFSLELVHVPTRGGSQATTELVGGQVETAVLGIGPILQHILAGRLKALAVTTPARVTALPQVPTLAELGATDFATSQWFGLAAPLDTPDARVDELARAVGRAITTDLTRQKFEELGFTPQPSSPKEFTDKVRAEEEAWVRLIEQRGLKF